MTVRLGVYAKWPSERSAVAECAHPLVYLSLVSEFIIWLAVLNKRYVQQSLGPEWQPRGAIHERIHSEMLILVDIPS